jgi:hypothetical protein
VPIERKVRQPSGQDVRVLEVTTLQSDGTYAAVEMQVVSIVDPQGQILNLDTNRIESLLEQINQKLGQILFMKGGL